MREYVKFWIAMIAQVVKGPKLYYAWLGFLALVITVGGVAYVKQLEAGLIVTNMTDPVSWGAYIANFTYIVGLAAAAVMLVIPAYIYKIKAMKEIVLIGDLFAVSAIVMCILFVVVDMGRPERFWHMLPVMGRLNWPRSLLAWDVIVLNGYLLLNLHIPGYLLYKKFQGQPPTERYYHPFVIISIFWAISIHTVTAFLYSGLGGRPYWNTAIVAPRFIASAFAVGPSFLILILQVIKRYSDFRVKDEAFLVLKRIVAVASIINLFLLGSEVFKEFYTNSAHSASATYLFMGLHGYHRLTPYIWTAVVFNCIATLIFASKKWNHSTVAINIACVLGIVGIWIEKGMGLIIPGFVPSPLGQIVEYSPSAVETAICAAIWAIGALIFTVFVKAAIPIETGKLRQTPATSL